MNQIRYTVIRVHIEKGVFLGGQPRVGSRRRQNIGAAYLSAHGITDNNQILHDDPAIDEKKIFL